MSKNYVTIDFETEPIRDYPDFPPRPVGVSIKVGARKPVYYAWGHAAGGNNCDIEKPQAILQDLFKDSRVALLFHNAKFDLKVAQRFMGCTLPSWDRVHDTMFLLALDDPHAPDFGLKTAAERLLKMKPEERDLMRDWLIEQRIINKSKKKVGEFIHQCPGHIVGPYANGDVIRTAALFDVLLPSIIEEGMMEAYNRERQLLPILMQNEEDGMRVDMPLLRKDVAAYLNAMEVADGWLRKKLKTKELNIDSNEELADALEREGIVTEFDRTPPSKAYPEGQRSVAKNTLTVDKFKDKRVFQALGYRNRLATCLKTFMMPWLTIAEATKGSVHTDWSQVRQGGFRDTSGARTGRMSSSPNFMNIPKTLENRGDGFEHPSFLQVPTLPLMRQYILPDKNQTFGHRDYNQQEFRILAHFEDGALLQAYEEDPTLDLHTFVQQEFTRILNHELDRSIIKQLNFGKVYGMGLGALASKMQTSVEEAKKLRDVQNKLLPGLVDLEKLIKYKGLNGHPIYTWGGRRYFAEAPKIINGKTVRYEYKLLNYLIQGSAADCTKQAIINYHAIKKDGRFLCTVHDEINISAPKALIKSELLVLREAMESVKFDVPMRSDPKCGPRWSELKSFKETR